MLIMLALLVQAKFQVKKLLLNPHLQETQIPFSKNDFVY
jgi:hypothetical protein